MDKNDHVTNYQDFLKKNDITVKIAPQVVREVTDIDKLDILNVQYQIIDNEVYIKGVFYITENIINVPIPIIIREANSDVVAKSGDKIPNLGNLQFDVVKGDFIFEKCGLNTLKGAPNRVQGRVGLRENNLTTLKHSPKVVGGDYDCSSNNLTNLSFGPTSVGRNFICSNNKHLKSLKNGPREVGNNYECSDTAITTLQGIPEKIDGMVNCARNEKMKQFGGYLKEVGSLFDASGCGLITLEGAPERVLSFRCYNNKKKFTEEEVRAVCEVEHVVKN